MTISEARLRQLSELLTRAALEGASGICFYPSQLIGEGGQGWVYRAGYDEPDGPLVVVKVLRPDVVNEEALARFLRESDVLRKLGQSQAPSPNVVRFFDHGICRYKMPDGEIYALPFTVMEFVNGLTLGQILAQTPDKGLAVARVRRLFRQVARALSLIHAAQIVHRDLKPSNLIVATELTHEVAKITDFGLVKRFDIDAKGTMALAGASVGYAPPEQFELGNRRVSKRTDLFSFASVLFEALTGQSAFGLTGRDTPFQVLSRILSGPRPSVAARVESLAPELAERRDLMMMIDRELERATRADPGDRHESILEFWEPVEAALRLATERTSGGTTRMPAREPIRPLHDPVPAPRASPHAGLHGAPHAAQAGAPVKPSSGGSGEYGAVRSEPVPLPLPPPPPSTYPSTHPPAAMSAAMPFSVGASTGPSAALLQAQAAGSSQAPASSLGHLPVSSTPNATPRDVPGGHLGPMKTRPGALLPDRAWSMVLGPEGRVAYALGRFGLLRHEGTGWSSNLLPPTLEPMMLRGVLTTPGGEPVVYGERGALWGQNPDGSFSPWTPPDPEVVWLGASLMPHPAEIVLVGEHAAQRQPALGVLRPGQALARRLVEGGRRFHAATRLVSGSILACGEGGELIALGNGPAEPVAWGRTGHLTAVIPSPDGGAHVVGNGGHALYITATREARLEPVQTTRDLLCLAMGPTATPWAGGQDGRLVRRTLSGWVRVALPSSVQGNIRAISAGPASLVVLLDDGQILEGTLA